jgi:hypothetical protein
VSVLWCPKTAVILHIFDCRLPQEEWLYVMWGTPEAPGRIPTAVAVILETGAEALLVFHDTLCFMPEPDGRNEAEVIKDTLFERLEELPGFANSLRVFSHVEVEEIRRRISESFRVLDPDVLNTDEEVQKALPMLEEMGMEHVVWVSSPDHISRVAQRVCELGMKKSINVSFRPSRTLSSGAMEDVVVIEPAAVQQLLPIHPRRLLSLRGNPEALARIEEVLLKVGV